MARTTKAVKGGGGKTQQAQPARFTDKMLKALQPEAKKYYLREGEGFAIRVLPSGVKTWLSIYTFEGQRREFNLGQYPDVLLSQARIKHGDARKALAAGIDPAAADRKTKDERRAAPTVKTLSEEYIEQWAKPRKKRWEEDQRMLTKDVLPVLGSVKAVDVKRRDVVLMLEDIARRPAPVQANRVKALLSKLFNFAVEREVCEFNPCVGIKALTRERPRERTLTTEEIKKVWTALVALDELLMGSLTARALQLILLTGQRPGEVAGMHRREIDGEWWTIPAERAKNGNANRVYLTETVRAVIGEAEGYIFALPLFDDEEEEKPIKAGSLPTALRRNLRGVEYRSKTSKRRQAGDSSDLRIRLEVAPFTPHDLRRTLSTHLSRLEFPDEVINAVTNHVKKGVVRTYNRHNYDAEKKRALEAWEAELLRIVSEEAEEGKIQAE